MKRRNFGLLAGSCVAVAATRRTASAQTAPPDPGLLTTTLTPLGAERAGNADGSIPAWTGGLTAPPLPPDQRVDVELFTDEQPLYTVDGSNMAQYQDMLTAGTQAMMTKLGFSIKVYPTHRTAAAPQYMYDNTAKNVTRAKLDPAGGRFGFTEAYGGVPFPIIDTSDPSVAGAQLIWNHLTAWGGNSNYSLFNPGSVVIDGSLELVSATASRTIFPYYDPKGTLETFDGYYSKAFYTYKAPSSAVGQEQVVWHTTNVNVQPDIVWSLLNGQGRVRKAPDQAYDAPSPAANGIANIDEASCFYGNPSQYDWTYMGKREMLVPYNCNAAALSTLQDVAGPKFPNPDIIRWEKHRVWVVEATLHPGEHNVNARRRFYMDEDTWHALLGEGYDADGNMVKVYTTYERCIPSMPGSIVQGTMTLSLLTDDYTYNGNVRYPPYKTGQFITPQPASDFNPQAMAANASF